MHLTTLGLVARIAALMPPPRPHCRRDLALYELKHPLKAAVTDKGRGCTCEMFFFACPGYANRHGRRRTSQPRAILAFETLNFASARDQGHWLGAQVHHAVNFRVVESTGLQELLARKIGVASGCVFC